MEEPRSIDEVLSFYESSFNERNRLLHGTGLLELARSQELIKRFIPEPPAVVADIGGAAGIYSCWLARQGYRANLVDPVIKHIEQAREASVQQPDAPLAGIFHGDARSLPFCDESHDIVLLMGPLYHLTERADRIMALKESNRILRTGGIAITAAIGRYASLMDGLRFGLIDDPVFVDIIRRDLAEGQHRNPNKGRSYFTTSFFHTPGELTSELEESGFCDVQVFAIEGPGELVKDFTQRWFDIQKRELLLDLIRNLEEDPVFIGISPHIMGIGIKDTTTGYNHG